jgi:hypothetical protein
VATVTRLRAKTIDDVLDLLDLLMVTELAGKAHQQVNKATIRRWPRFAKASSRLAAAVQTLLEAAERGEDVRLSEVLEMIDAIVARPDLHAAVAEVTATVPPPDADDDGGWRQEMATHFPTVSGLVKTLTSAIEFDANTEGQPALRAMRALPAALAYRSHHHSMTLLPARLIDPTCGAPAAGAAARPEGAGQPVPWCAAPRVRAPRPVGAPRAARRNRVPRGNPRWPAAPSLLQGLAHRQVAGHELSRLGAPELDGEGELSGLAGVGGRGDAAARGGM